MIGSMVSHEIALRLRKITARFATNEGRRVNFVFPLFYQSETNLNAYSVLLTERSSSLQSTKA